MKTANEPGHTGKLSWLTLFVSTGTLLCCALPILLVSLGLGATVAALTSNIPFLITLGENKAWVFALSGGLLLLTGWLLYRTGRACPTDRAMNDLCSRAHLWNRRIHGSSVAIWSIGFFAAYLALPIRIWLGV